jgi:hypothetical protein
MIVDIPRVEMAVRNGRGETGTVLQTEKADRVLTPCLLVNKQLFFAREVLFIEAYVASS